MKKLSVIFIIAAGFLISTAAFAAIPWNTYLGDRAEISCTGEGRNRDACEFVAIFDLSKECQRRIMTIFPRTCIGIAGEFVISDASGAELESQDVECFDDGGGVISLRIDLNEYMSTAGGMPRNF